jgi:two-component system, LytTR family, response regulator
MIKTIIVDDEINAREFLEKLLIRYFPNKFIVLDRCKNVDEAISAIRRYNPELVFLDIQMPNKSGIELFKEIKEINFEVIFTTAHTEFAIDAIRINALDYLLKPINYIDLLSTVKRLEKKRVQIKNDNNLRLLIKNIDTGSSGYKNIAFPTESGFELIKVNSILYCVADNNYCNIVCLDGTKTTLSKSLKYVEESLPNDIFQRIHKSYLVNLNYVSRFNKTNDLLVELTNGENLPVSIRKKEAFINAILNKN